MRCSFFVFFGGGLKTHVLEKSSNSTVKVLESWGTSMTFISCVLKINYLYLYLKIKMLILLQAFGHQLRSV